MFLVCTKYHLGDKIKNKEMGTEWVTYGVGDKCIPGLDLENWGEETTWKTYALIGEYYWNGYSKTNLGDVDWINLASYREKLRVLVNGVMKL